MSYLNIRNLSKLYPGKTVPTLKDFQLTISKGELVVILGPSGSGKSTLLNILVGFEPISTGAIYLAGKQIDSLLPKERNMALVFQDYALFPHLTVAENILFGMKIRKASKKMQQEKLTWITNELQLTSVLTEKPKQLSGGQRQRVALARALVRNPALLLMDEPLSNLDNHLREQISQLILDVHQKFQTTMLYVTHNQEEAMKLADRIVVLNNGAIQQIATPREMYQNPTNLFVASFIGQPKINLFKGKVNHNGELSVHGTVFKTKLPLANQEISIGIRSEDIDLNNQKGPLTGKITRQTYYGHEVIVDVLWQGITLKVKGKKELTYAKNSLVSFDLPQEKLLYFDKNENRI